MQGIINISLTFLQLTDLLHVLQVTLADIRPDKLIKTKIEKKCDGGSKYLYGSDYQNVEFYQCYNTYS